MAANAHNGLCGEGDWKLIGNVQSPSNDPLSAEDQRLFLSNLANDVSERTNLASEHSDVVERLSKLHADWLERQKSGVQETASFDKKGNEQ